MDKSESSILLSVVEITEQKDIDSLEASVFKTLAEMFPIFDITLFKKQKGEFISVLNLLVEGDEQQWLWHEDSTLNISAENQQKLLTTKDYFYFNSEDNENCVACPVYNQNDIIGIILLASKEIDFKKENGIAYFIRIYENYIEIIDESERDVLTHLFNRRTFEKKLTKLLVKQEGNLINPQYTQQNKRHSQKTATAWLVMFDIDHFKSINDTYGHLYGDDVLLTISQVMKDSFRRNDLMFRFGGDEFVIILEPITFEQAELTLNRFREKIAAYNFPQFGSLTISMGYCAASKHDFPGGLLENADKALYFSKENGRNQVNCFQALINSGEIQPLSTNHEAELF